MNQPIFTGYNPENRNIAKKVIANGETRDLLFMDLGVFKKLYNDNI
jgi:hypothetical protein